MKLTILTLALLSVSFLPLLHAQDGATNPATGADGTGGVSPATAVYTNLVGSPTSAVPGLLGVSFQPSTTSTVIFDRVYGNRFGNWALRASTDQGTTLNEIIIADGLVIAQEGTLIPGLGADTYGIFDTQLAVSEVPSVLFANNSNGATTSDELILSWTVGGTVVVAQEGLPTNFDPLLNYGTLLDSVAVTGTGIMGFSADSVTGASVTTTTNDFVELGGAVLAQVGVTVPLDQAGAGSAAWENFDFGRFVVSANGLHYALQGDLVGTTNDDVLVVDGRVVLQEGGLLPGFLSPINSVLISGINMGPTGSWIARGSNLDADDWVVLNGQVVARRGAPITAGTTELWDDASFGALYFAHHVDSFGNYVIGGVTDAAATSNGVMVYNGNQVVARENDAIDIDGNGLFDDDAFFNTFGNDDLHLSDTGILSFMATIRNGAGTQIGSGFFQISVNNLGLHASAAGTVVDINGLPQNTLRVNGFTGGGRHILDLPGGSPITLDFDGLTGYGVNDYAIFVLPGIASSGSAVPVLPGLTFTFMPALTGLITPSITLSSGLPASLVQPGALPAALPFQLVLPAGLPTGVSLTLQGAYLNGGGLQISNALAFTLF